MKKTTSVSSKKLLPSGKMFLTICLFLTMTAVSAFAGKSYPVNEDVKEAFKKEFPGAEVLNWDDAGDYIRAVFILNGYRSEAYFDSEEELQLTVRNIFFNQLPLAVTKTVDKKFPNADILEVTEISRAEGTSYRIRLETTTKKYKMNLDANGAVISMEKSKK